MMATTVDSNSTPLTILCTMGMRGVLEGLAGSLRARGLPFTAVYEPTNLILRRLAGGERADVTILLDTTIEQLTRDGMLLAGSRRDLARTGVAIAVRAGAPKPDISTVDAFKRALLAAPSIAYTKSGASGIYFASVLERLGIADAVNSRARVEDGFVGELAARGEVSMSVQQMSELLPIPGIDVVGPLPDEVQKITVFSAGIFAGTGRAEAARALIASLASPEAEEMIRNKGLEPASAFV
jgi:molybdate transport system substrate-binding protein